MIVLASVILGALLLVLTSSVLFVFHVESWVVLAGVIVAVQASLRRRFEDAALIVLLVAWIADLLASGPPGLHGLVLTLVFFVVFVLAQRVGGRYLFATFSLAFGASVVLTFAESLLIGLVLGDAATLGIWARVVVPSALITGIVAVPYSLLLSLVEQLWRRRTERTVRVE